MSLSDIVVEIGGITEVQQSLAAKLRAAKSMDEVTAIADEVDGVFGRSKKLRERLTKPNPEDFTPSKEHVAAIEGALSRVKTSEAKVKETEAAMDAFAKQSTAQKSEVFAFQRQLRALQQELFGLEQSANAVQIELTRVETRMEAIEKEMKDDVGGERAAAMKKTLDFRLETLDVTALHEKMIRLKHQLELIGGIDEEVMKEYATTNERFTFLTSQVKDLRDAIRSTEKIIDELDGEIRAQSEKAFSAINKEFQRYFKVLFGGGSCSLVKMTQEDVENDTKINLDRAMEEMAEEKQEAESVQAITARVAERKEAVAGVDIQATPPGKKLKALNLLSGGERADVDGADFRDYGNEPVAICGVGRGGCRARRGEYRAVQQYSARTSKAHAVYCHHAQSRNNGKSGHALRRHHGRRRCEQAPVGQTRRDW